MPRPTRVHFPGAVYHVMSRGIDGRFVLGDPSEKRLFLDTLRRLKRQKNFQIYAWCLMSNHFHLVMRMLSSTLSEVMHVLLTRFALLYNKNHDRAGYVFQNRYQTRLCTSDRYLMTLLRYVHLNPVRAGLVSTPDQWEWSGHLELLRPYTNALLDRELPLSLFGKTEGSATAAYNQFLYAALSDRSEELPVADDGPALEESIALCPDSSLMPHASGIEQFGAEIASMMGVPLDTLLSDRRGGISLARARFIKSAFEAGFRVSAIARFLGKNKSSISRVLSADA